MQKPVLFSACYIHSQERRCPCPPKRHDVIPRRMRRARQARLGKTPLRRQRGTGSGDGRRPAVQSARRERGNYRGAAQPGNSRRHCLPIAGGHSNHRQWGDAPRSRRRGLSPTATRSLRTNAVRPEGAFITLQDRSRSERQSHQPSSRQLNFLHNPSISLTGCPAAGRREPTACGRQGRASGRGTPRTVCQSIAGHTRIHPRT